MVFVGNMPRLQFRAGSSGNGASLRGGNNLPLDSVISNGILPDRKTMKMNMKWSRVAALFLRLALGASFLSAVADRFGLWGTYGLPNVAWGTFDHFVQYTGQLNWFLPKTLIPPTAWAETALETLLGLLLIVGLFTQVAALLSGVLLLLFALAMSFALGVKAPLDYSVFSASAGAFLLAALSASPLFALDSFRRR